MCPSNSLGQEVHDARRQAARISVAESCCSRPVLQRLARGCVGTLDREEFVLFRLPRVPSRLGIFYLLHEGGSEFLEFLRIDSLRVLMAREKSFDDPGHFSGLTEQMR